MTIPPETERGYGKPVEESARAIKEWVPFGYGMTDAEAQVYARAVINLLRSKGWLSDLGITAIEAERMEK